MSIGRLVDSRLMRSLSGRDRIYNRTCTVQRAGSQSGVTTHDEFGAPNLKDNAYVDITGMIGIKCRFTPRNPTYRIEVPQEIKDQTKIEEKPQIHLALSGYFPNILLKDRIKMDDGKVFDVVFAEADSQQVNTRIMMQAVTI